MKDLNETITAVTDERSDGWKLVPIRDVTDINPKLDKSAIPDKLMVSFVPMQAVGAGDGTIDVSNLRPAAEVKKGFTNFQKDDVLFAKITPCMENGKMAIVPKVASGYGFGSTEFHVLRPKNGLDPRYLYYFVSSQSIRVEAAHNMTGAVGQKRVPTSYISNLEIPLAPPDQQRLIVAEIEKQFSRLDEAVANLKRVKTNLKRYKAAVLKAAVEGKLTEEWRKAHPDVEPASELLKRVLAVRRKRWEGAFPKKKYAVPVGPEIENLPAIPDTWIWTTLPQLGELNRGRSKHRPRNAPKLYGGPYPFIQTGDVRHASGIITHYEQTYSEAGLKQSKLWPKGTLCITIAANIADTAILGMDACFPDSIVGFIPESEYVDVRYVEYFIRTAKENIVRFAPATAQKNINLEILYDVAVPLPPLMEQRAIVDEIERKLSVADDVEKTENANTARAERLRQAILEKAFSGSLNGSINAI